MCVLSAGAADANTAARAALNVQHALRHDYDLTTLCFLASRAVASWPVGNAIETYREIRYSVAIRGKADVARTTHFGSD
jgi:hypothetical protein